MTSIRDVEVKLKAVRGNTSAGARAAATAMGSAYVRGVVGVELSASAHPRGTPTPSAPGSPPSRVSGALARSVHKGPTVGTGPGRSETVVGPRVVYGRIQELGGTAGRGHRSVLPPRPYMAPAAARMAADGSLHRAATDAFLDALDE